MSKLNNTLIASQVVELSEHPTYIELVDRVCYYNSCNANGVQLDYDESSLDKARTLIDMPVVAFYLSDKDGKPSLGGHAVVRTEDGIKFGTSAIGVHTDVWIDDAEVELVSGVTTTAKCLFSKMKIWNRYENMVSAVKRLYDENRLFNSWEISVSSYKYENNTKKLIDYEFIGNALLGEAIPAYGSASKVLTMASIEDEDPCLLVAEALSADLIGGDLASNINQLDESESDRKEMTPKVEANENVNVDNAEVIVEEDTVETVDESAQETAEEIVETNTEEVVSNEEAEVSDDNPVSDEAEAETSETGESDTVESVDTAENTDENSEMLTEEDIREAIHKAVRALNDDEVDVRYYIGMIFPEDHVVLVRTWRMKNLQYIQYTYRMEGDKAILEDKKDVELIISPLNINSEIESRNNAISEANNRINELENENAELIKAKEELDKIKADKEEIEKAEAKNKLREYIIKSGRFTEEEIASEKIQNAINELNEVWIKAEIADRYISSLEADSSNVETSETNTNKPDVSINLGSTEGKSATSEDIMRAFFED